MNIVVDTNVVISGVFFGGYPKKILEAVIDKKYCACVTKKIVNEYHSTVDSFIESRKRKPDNNIFSKFISNVEAVHSSSHVDICRDPDDNKFLECAIDSSALYIVSGDKDLLTIKSFKGVQIIKAKDFCEKYLTF